MNADEAHQQELEHQRFDEDFERIFGKPYCKTAKELNKIIGKLENLNERQTKWAKSQGII